MSYIFFYDEAEHSRKININTINATNFSDDFTAVIIGYDETKTNIPSDYLAFESIYKAKLTTKELKSTAISPKQLQYGFAGLNTLNVELINAFLSFVIEKDLMIYFSIWNKIEYITAQLLKNYTNSIFIDADSFRYSLTKMLTMYKPQKVYEALYRNDGSFIDELKCFLRQRINKNQGLSHKTFETHACEEALLILSTCNNTFIIDWDYSLAFTGFNQYLAELKILDYSLILDKEGTGKTLSSARNAGLTNVSEEDSKLNVGIRIADMLAGIISKLLKNIDSALNYHSDVDVRQLQLISAEWFHIDEKKLNLYKKLRHILSVQNNAWYKSFSGNYADSFICLIRLLDYFSKFDSLQDFQKLSVEQHKMRLNRHILEGLREHFDRLRSKLPITPITTANTEYYFNQRGAKCYHDYTKHAILPIPKFSPVPPHGAIYTVLSVGFFGKLEHPCITIQQNSQAECYLLPMGLSDWTVNLLAITNTGAKIFPCDVEFCFDKDGYYATLL